MSAARGQRLAGWYLAAAMAMVGANVALGKFIVAQVPVFAFLLIRAAIACAVFLPEYRAHRRAGVALSRSERRNLFLQAFLGIFLFSTCMLFGLRLTSAAAAGVITSTIPAAVALLSWIVLRERLPRAVAVSIALAIAGVAVLNLARDHGGQTNLAGNALVLGAVFCEASYVILSKRLTTTLSAMRISAFANAYAAAVVLPFGLWEFAQVPWRSLGPGVWLTIVWYSLAASVFAFWFWMKGIAHLPANRAGVFTAVLPVTAALTAVVGLGEALSAAHLVAFGCVVIGIWIAARAPIGPRA